MDFEFYHNFIVVAETGNLTEAAQKLAIVQPALSRQIKSLEKRYGVKLIQTNRGKRSLVLTEAGIDFLAKARQLCLTEENLSLDMQGYSQKAVGTLHFSVSPAVAQLFMEEYLLPFSKSYPNISFQLREEAVSEQIVSIRRGLSDFAYANAPIPDTTGMECFRLRTERFYAVYNPNILPLDIPKEQPIKLPQLVQYPLSCNFGCYGLVNHLFEEQQLTPDFRFVSTTGISAVEFVRQNPAIAIVSDATSSQTALARRLIDEKDLFYEQTLFWSAQLRLRPIVSAFLNFFENKNKKL